MRCERIGLSGDAAALARELRARVPAPASVASPVAEIVAAVRAGGDAAVRDYTRRFDCPRAPDALRVPDATIDRALAGLDPAVRAGLAAARANVGAVAAAAVAATHEPVVELAHGTVRLRRAAVDRAAVYVPGGRAPYPSTVVMGVVSARAAGVGEVVVAAPPGRGGEIDPTVLAACRLTGADAVYRMGGAQAIAALAHGTESIPPVDVIVGPGNLYVQEAKRQCSDVVGIDSFAGPSDLLVLAAGDAPAGPLALDLLAQAEHGPGTLVLAAAAEAALLDALAQRIAEAPGGEAIIVLVELGALDPDGLALAQAFAPEHLQLAGAAAEALAARCTRAGCLFVGAAAGTAFGDYVAGSNHILPTTGAARFASGLTPAHFTRTFAEVRIDDPVSLARAAAPVARAEGFELHAQSMEARISENGHDGKNG